MSASRPTTQTTDPDLRTFEISINPNDSEKRLRDTFTNLTILLTLITALNNPFGQPTFWGAQVLKERLDHANYSTRRDDGSLTVMEAATQILVVNKEILALMSCGENLKGKCMVSAEPVNQDELDEPPAGTSSMISNCWRALKLWAAPNPGDTGTTGLRLVPDEYVVFSPGKENGGRTLKALPNQSNRDHDCHAESLWPEDKDLDKFDVGELLQKQRSQLNRKGPKTLS
jgi:hypothetical protein